MISRRRGIFRSIDVSERGIFEMPAILVMREPVLSCGVVLTFPESRRPSIPRPGDERELRTSRIRIMLWLRTGGTDARRSDILSDNHALERGFEGGPIMRGPEEDKELGLRPSVYKFPLAVYWI